MTDDEIHQRLYPLSADLNYFDYISKHRPKLAHYTSVEVLEKILKTEQIWFASPLLMNDRQEMVYGLGEGTRFFNENKEITKACGTEPRANALRHYYYQYLREFSEAHARQVFVLCFSEYTADRPDGLLSMWRGYGANGNGAALVFDTSLIHRRDEVPIIISKVTYGGNSKRINVLRDKFIEYAAVIESLAVPDNQLWIFASRIFNYVKISALAFKHLGFEEEHEWRLIYLPERDTGGVFTKNTSYFIGPRGPEPKLKLPIAPIPIDPILPWTFADILDRIVLGPTLSNPLTEVAVKTMLTECGKAHFIPKLHSSTIPFRVI